MTKLERWFWRWTYYTVGHLFYYDEEAEAARGVKEKAAQDGPSRP